MAEHVDRLAAACVEPAFAGSEEPTECGTRLGDAQRRILDALGPIPGGQRKRRHRNGLVLFPPDNWPEGDHDSRPGGIGRARQTRPRHRDASTTRRRLDRRHPLLVRSRHVALDFRLAVLPKLRP
ncbi:MAG: hypothetical protein OXH15_19865 [Gammaproteobacteria bacterium]|nr:hypothetical protein [Gammaproteobacteria bacterium]